MGSWWLGAGNAVPLALLAPREGKKRRPLGRVLQWCTQRSSEWQGHQKPQQTGHLSYHGVIKVGKGFLDGACIVLSLNSPLSLGGSCTVSPHHLGFHQDKRTIKMLSSKNMTIISAYYFKSWCGSSWKVLFSTINGWAQSQAVTEPCQHLEMEGSTGLVWPWLNLKEHTAKIPK